MRERIEKEKGREREKTSFSLRYNFTKRGEPFYRLPIDPHLLIF